MPFTPFHFGPALLFGVLFFRHIDFIGLFVSSVIVDVEPFLILVFGLGYPLHGFFHSFIGGGILAVLSSVLIYLFKPFFGNVLKFFRVYQEASLQKIVSTSLYGVFLHIVLDALLYEEMNPFYPLRGNPLHGFFDSFAVYQFCILSFLIGLLLYLYKFFIKNSATTNINSRF